MNNHDKYMKEKEQATLMNTMLVDENDQAMFMSDEELAMLINDIEKSDLVKAPPEIKDKILYKIDKREQIIEYKRFRNKVILAVAAIVFVTLLSPAISSLIEDSVSKIVVSDYVNGIVYYDEYTYGHDTEISYVKDTQESEALGDRKNTLSRLYDSHIISNLFE